MIFLEKLSSYNLFNYLLPGVIFSLLVDQWTDFKLVQEDIVSGLFLYYFIGLVISRLGSLLIEPSLKSLHVIEFEAYERFVAASQKDAKIEVLSEANNMYRTFAALFLSFLATMGYDILSNRCGFTNAHHASILSVLLFTMFLLAYRKQTSYITRRVRNATVGSAASDTAEVPTSPSQKKGEKNG